jgi:hypothetical protein
MVTADASGLKLPSVYNAVDTEKTEDAMKEGLRFVDSDMHVQEPGDLFEKYLDPAFKSRVTSAVGADGSQAAGRGT